MHVACLIAGNSKYYLRVSRNTVIPCILKATIFVEKYEFEDARFFDNGIITIFYFNKPFEFWIHLYLQRPCTNKLVLLVVIKLLKKKNLGFFFPFLGIIL